MKFHAGMFRSMRAVTINCELTWPGLNSVLGSYCKLQSPNFTGGFPEPLETPLPTHLLKTAKLLKECNTDKGQCGKRCKIQTDSQEWLCWWHSQLMVIMGILQKGI